MEVQKPPVVGMLDLKVLAGLILCVLLVMSGCGTDESAQWAVNEPDAGEEDQSVEEERGPDMEMEEPLPELTFPPEAHSVATRLVLDTIRAGELVLYECLLLDEDGEELGLEDPPDFSVAVSPSETFRREAGQIRGVRVGTGFVRCSAPSLGLVDEDPPMIEILPGPIHTVVTHLDRAQIRAGESVQASCEAYDAFGNEVEKFDSTLRVAPFGEGVSIDELRATITAADVYDVSCQVEGAMQRVSRDLEVLPGLPAHLIAGKSPEEQTYGLGQVISIVWLVTDEYGNEIPNADVSVVSDPDGESFGIGRFRYHDEGVYTVTVTVEEPTADDPLSQEVVIVVNETGPSIQCDDPFDGGMLNVTPNTMISFQGSVADANGVASVTVNGNGVVVGSDGTFATQVRARYGINFVEIVAVDDFGAENSRTCAFLAANRFNGERSFFPNTVSLKLRQSAIDSGQATPITSLNSLLLTVLNSQGLQSTLHDALMAANPLKPSSCDSQTCTFLGCVCWYRSEVIYLNLDIAGPSTSELTLRTNGLRAYAEIQNLRIRVRVRGHVSGIPYNTTGWVTFSHVRVDLNLDAALQSGQPTMWVSNINSVEVGSVSTNFSGIDGFFINIIVSLFNGTVRNLVADALRGFISSSFNEVLDGVVSSLDINSLGTSFQVPRLDGSGTIPISFALQFDSLSFSSTRALFGIGTRFRGPQVHVRPSLGVPYPAGAVLRDPITSQPTALTVHVGVLNDVLHTLWRGGFFDATIDGTTLGGFPDGTSVQLQTDLPPVVQNITDNQVQLMLGAARLSLVYPGIFDEPLQVTLGAVANSSASISGDSLDFSGVVIDELVFSTTDVSLDATTRAVLENFLLSLVQSIVDNSLNNALPALPIPSFELPASLSVYGLPANAQLGLLAPTFFIDPRHYRLEGGFGVQ